MIYLYLWRQTNGIFQKKIYENINLIRNNNAFISNIDKDEQAFNYWILDNIYNVDSEVMETQITNYNAKEIDSYDFFVRPINSLKNNPYSRSKEI